MIPGRRAALRRAVFLAGVVVLLSAPSAFARPPRRFDIPALPAADALCTASLMTSWAIFVNCACMVPPFAPSGRLHPWALRCLCLLYTTDFPVDYSKLEPS